MAKKGTKPANASQQRMREEQWRRRIESGGQAAKGTTATVGGAAPYQGMSEGETATAAPATANNATITTVTFAPSSAAASTATRSAPAQRPASSASSRVGSAPGAATAATPAANLAAQRRAAAAARSARNRIANTGLSLEDEMHYVRTDVRRLIILTAVCVALLLVLFLVIR